MKKIITALRRFIGWMPPAVVPALAPVVAGAIASKVGVRVPVDLLDQVLMSAFLSLGTHAVARTTNPPPQDPPAGN